MRRGQYRMCWRVRGAIDEAPGLANAQGPASGVVVYGRASPPATAAEVTHRSSPTGGWATHPGRGKHRGVALAMWAVDGLVDGETGFPPSSPPLGGGQCSLA